MYQKAGFLMMGEGQFDKILAHFIKGALDPRILICLFPEFSQDKSFDEFRKTLKQNFGFESVDEMAEKLKPKITPEVTKTRCTELLRDYLEHLRSAKVSGARKEEIDTCLAKVYAKGNSSRLYDLLKKDNDVSLQLESYLRDLKVLLSLLLLKLRLHSRQKLFLNNWIVNVLRNITRSACCTRPRHKMHRLWISGQNWRQRSLLILILTVESRWLWRTCRSLRTRISFGKTRLGSFRRMPLKQFGGDPFVCLFVGTFSFFVWSSNSRCCSKIFLAERKTLRLDPHRILEFLASHGGNEVQRIFLEYFVNTKKTQVSETS